MRRLYLSEQITEQGFSLVEILLACALFAMTVTAVAGAIAYGNGSAVTNGNRTQAVLLADEGLQAARNIRNAGFSNLTDGTFGLTTAGNTYGFSGASDTNGIFTRSVTIASNGLKRKTVTSTVSWNEGFGGSRSYSVSTQLSNWVATMKSWPGSIQYGSLDLAGTNDGYRIDTAGKYAYLIRSSGTPNFYVIDISTPSAPTIVGSQALTGTLTDVRVRGNYAYVTSTDDAAELQIVNVTNPASPTVTSSYNAAGTGDGQAVFVSGTVAFVARTTAIGSPEFVAVNITDPASPALLYSYSAASTLTDVVILGNYAYIGTSNGTVLVIDVSSILALGVIVGQLITGTYTPPGTGAVTAIDAYGSNLLIGRGSTFSTANIGLAGFPGNLGSVATTGAGTINYIDADPTSGFAFLGTSYTAGEFQVVALNTLTSPSIARTVDITGTSSNLTGIAYNPTYDVVVGASAYDNGELQIFGKN